MIHCGYDPLRDSLPHITGVNEDEICHKSGERCKVCALKKSVRALRIQNPGEMSRMCNTKTVERIHIGLVKPVKVLPLELTKYFAAAYDGQNGYS